MFIVDKDSNRITPVHSKAFQDLGFKERENLQEWIANQPDCLGESLLIIQKEFDGFSGTNERLDLLALDKEGSIVVIENKLDDSGKDVVWQVLKYVSYCSTLTKQQIVEIFQSYLDKFSPGSSAEERIAEFFDNKPFNEIILNGKDQRMILVAGGYFRKEVTATVMWMLNHKIRVQCLKFQLKEYDNQIYLDVEQIIPAVDAEEYFIKMADKSREENEISEKNRGIEVLRIDFWNELLKELNKHTNLYRNVSASEGHWLSAGSGVRGCPYDIIITKSYVSLGVSIVRTNREENKKIFDNLIKMKPEIDGKYGEGLIWERMEEKKMSRIAHRLEDVDLTDRNDWKEMINFFCKHIPKLEEAFKEPLKKAVKNIN